MPGTPIVNQFRTSLPTWINDNVCLAEELEFSGDFAKKPEYECVHAREILCRNIIDIISSEDM